MARNRRKTPRRKSKARPRKQPGATVDRTNAGVLAEPDEVILSVRLLVKRSELATVFLNRATLVGASLPGIEQQPGDVINTTGC